MIADRNSIRALPAIPGAADALAYYFFSAGQQPCAPIKKVYPLSQFKALGLSETLAKTVTKLGYDTPTPIQQKAIPLLLEGKDVMGLAQTGTGKTAAFGLPLIDHLLKIKSKPAPQTVRALILAPTRELANQIAANMRDYVRGTPLRVTCIVGGSSIHMQKKNLARGTDILVATPGRLLDLADRKALFLNTAKFLVLDEADQMLDLGFIHSLRKIAKLLGTPRQTLLFSATMPKQMAEISRTYLNNPERLEMAPPGRAADKVRQSVHFVDQGAKAGLLKQCLGKRDEDISLVFSRTKRGAEKLMKNLVAHGLPAGSIHGNKSQGQRDRALKAFKNGDIRILVATDVAARGIDVPGVSHVYNFDLPEVPENYVHRIGRTARAGATGEAVAFCAPAENHLLRNIEKLMGVTPHVASGEPGEDEGKAPGKARKNRARNRSRNNQNPRRAAAGADKGANRKRNSSRGRPGRRAAA